MGGYTPWVLALETRIGAPIAVAGATLVPVARSVRLELCQGGVIWNRPIGVLVDAAGREKLVPVRDRTRRLQLTLLGAGLAGSFILRLVRRRRRGRAPDHGEEE